MPVMLVITVLFAFMLLVGVGWQRFSRKKYDFQEKTQQLLQSLYRKVNASVISFDERKRLNLDEDAYIYGEIEFSSFYILLASVKPKPGEVFYDLGSGSGRAVLAAALFFDFSKACGIEFLPALCLLANTQRDEAKSRIIAKKDAFTEIYLQRFSSIEFMQGNFLRHDFSDGDIILISATCFSYPTWQKLMDQLLGIKTGSRVMVISKRIQHEKFQLMLEQEVLMSWGMSLVRVYMRV